MCGGPRVIIDALSARVGGGLTYITQQLSSLERVRPDLDLFVLTSPINEEAIRKATDCEIRVIRAPNLASRIVFEQTILPILASKGDVLYCPANFCPLFHGSLPVVLTLRNAHHFGQGKSIPHDKPLRKKAEIQLAHASAKRADIVVAVSEFLRSQMLEDGIESSKIRVIPSGLPKLPEKMTKPWQLEELSDFFVCIANDHAIKRLNDLVRAWSSAFKETIDPPALVLAGQISSERKTEHAQIVRKSQQPFLIHLGSVADRSIIKWLLVNARALVTTSELESFGFTVIEARSVGCPAIVTDIPAHRESVGEDAKFFSVGDLGGLSQALREAGPQPYRRVESTHEYSWEENANALATLFDEALNNRNCRKRKLTQGIE